MNRKRSHDDLEDADECLPISKRINSLHIEGKVQGICHNQAQQMNRFNINHHEETMIPSIDIGASGSSYQFPNHHHQLCNIPLGHHQIPAADKAQTSRLPIDINYNIANSGLTYPSAHSYSQPQLSPQSIYHTASTNPVILNSTNAHQMFPCDNNLPQNHPGTSHQHQNQNLCSFFTSQSASAFTNDQIPMSSCPGVSLVNNHHISTASGLSPHPNAADDPAHLIPGQLHGPISQDLPNRPYDPELGISENPHYYNNNKLLYEAHLSRLQRIIPDYQLHS